MKNLIIITSVLLLAACRPQTTDTESKIEIKIDEHHDVSIYDLFSKIDLIPLETSDESLIRSLSKVIAHDKQYFVFDFSLAQIFIFDMDGNYKGKINHRGKGPKEYISLTDFEINENNEVMILSADDAAMCCFDNGVMTKKIKLPATKRSYKSFKFLNEDVLVFWTFDEDNRVKFVSLKENKIISETFPEKVNNFNMFSPIEFPFGNHLCRSADNNVYEFTPDYQVIKSYSWDFGSKNNTPEMMPSGEGYFRSSEEILSFFRKTYASENINYIFSLQGGNSTYLYTQITRKNKRINIFYDKPAGKKTVFEKTTEGAKIYPVFWSEEYILGVVLEDMLLDEVAPDIILDEENRLKKSRITETDNPVLIKYYFKKEE